jgi:hypothetical protein
MRGEMICIISARGAEPYEKRRYHEENTPGTLRDWEQSRKEPDAAARAYLTVIARNPKAVTDALRPTP